MSEEMLTYVWKESLGLNVLPKSWKSHLEPVLPFSTEAEHTT